MASTSVQRKLDDEASRLIRESYREVLDATLHQADKVGRLLTAMAFLTAASLALVNVDSGRYLFAVFDVDGTRLPLATIAVGVFLVGVLLAVVMLVASLTAPMTLPTRAARRQRSEASPRAPKQSSLLYFYSIAGFSEADWRSRWDADVGVTAEMHDDYVGEVHNLAIRTNYKYDRMNEAVGVLRLSLLAFGISSLLVLVAGAQRWDPVIGRPVEFDLVTRALLATVIAAFCSVQVLATMRNESRRVEDPPLRLASERGYLLAGGPLLVTALLLPSDALSARAAGGIAILVAMLAGARREWLSLPAALLGCAGLFGLLLGNLAGRLACAVGIAFLLVARDVVEPAFRERRARERFLDEFRAPATGR